MNRNRSENYCKAKTKKGRPCRAAATDGGLCFFHANPDKAAALGRLGGMRNRHVVPEEMPSLPKLDSATAVRDIAARLIADVYAGKLHPRTAASLAPLLHLQLRVLENINIEQRLAKLENLSRITKTTLILPTTEVLEKSNEAPRFQPGPMQIHTPRIQASGQNAAAIQL